MYLFNFSKFAWSDKVFKVVNNDNFPKKIKTGDRVACEEDYFLVLWDQISFSERYTYNYTPAQKVEIIYPKLISAQNMEMAHWMVYTYYSTYKSVMRYFLTDEVESLLKREKWSKRKTKEKIDKILDVEWFNISKEWQTLIVFPDLWSLFNMTNETFLENKQVAFLRSSSTQNQKDKNRWEIKKWNVNVIISTHWEIFQDFADLKKIILIDPYKRYYANQQDPRYKVEAVLEKMKEVYNCELEILSI